MCEASVALAIERSASFSSFRRLTKQTLKIVENYPKQMPCNIEAEQAVIGSILISNEIYDEVSPILDSKKFLGGTPKFDRGGAT